MVIGLAFCVLAVSCGLAVQRGLRLPPTFAPVTGLAAMAILTSWLAALHQPPQVAAGAVTALGLCSIGLLALDGEWRTLLRQVATCRQPTVILAVATLLPTAILGSVFVGVDAPISTHDGAFHVETIEHLRRAVFLDTWYPLGFHAAAAAVLTLAPWLDSARGAIEIGVGLAILAPVALFGLARALGADTLTAALAALVISLTWTYPYDYHLWGGWPQGMGVLLATGVWVSALQWVDRPSLRWAIVAGLCSGAIVVTHGTDLYTAALGLAVIAVLRWRRLQLARLWWQAPLALVVAAFVVGPYLLTLLHWAGSGAAITAGQQLADSYAAVNTDAVSNTDWVQFIVNITGAASYVDLPVRVALIAVGIRLYSMRLAATLWGAFVGLLVLVQFIAVPFVSGLFALTYPWLDGRPREVVVLFAALLTAAGASTCLAWLAGFRTGRADQIHLRRRLALASVVLLAFFAEGSAVSIYKSLVRAVAEQNVLSPDDQAAMAWLRRTIRPGDVMANDQSADAGIWAPYKADVPILLPRSASQRQRQDGEAILDNVLDLDRAPAVEARACALHVEYIYRGAHGTPFEERTMADLAALERAPYLRKAFASGEAVVFRLSLPCGQAPTRPAS